MSHLDDESIEIDLSLLCRVCLKKPLRKTDFLDLNILYDEDESKTYAECFRECTELNLEDEEVQQPRNICKACGLELQIVYDFYKKLDKSNRILELQRQRNRIKYEGSVSADEPYETDEQDEETESKEELTEFKVESISTKLDEYEAEVLDEVLEQVELLEADEPTEEDIYDAVVEDVSEETNSPTTIVKYDIERRPNADQRHVSVACDDNEDNNQTEEQVSWQGAAVTTYNKSSSRLDQEQEIRKTNTESPPSLRTARKRYLGQYACDYCQKVFPNHSRMVIHRRSHEEDRPRLPCEECGREYATKQALQVHIDTVHMKKGYACEICHKVYAIKKALVIHMRFHTGDFPHECDICGRRFVQVGHLNTHRNVQHESVRFSCDFPGCGKFFTSSTSLRNHEFSHGRMPFECELCDRGYPSKSKLKVHIMRKHNLALSLQELERMRKFHVPRGKLSLVKVLDNDH